jgi:hypothetical protein
MSSTVPALPGEGGMDGWMDGWREGGREGGREEGGAFWRVTLLLLALGAVGGC